VTLPGLFRHRELFWVGQRRIPGHLAKEGNVQQFLRYAQGPGDFGGAIDLFAVALAIVKG